MTEQTTELMVLPSDRKGLEQVFIKGQDIDSTIAKIREESKYLPVDMTVRKNREEVASFAYKIARSKTAVDKAGAALSAEYKEIPKKIDANRRVYKEAFESLQAEVRQPLTEWEQRESDRKAAHERAIDKINLRINEHHHLDASETKANIQWLESDVVINDSWEEYELEAGRARDRALKALREHLVFAEAREAEQAELARLRLEAEERERADREERIAREAAESARKHAEQEAQAEREKLESDRVAAEKAVEQAKRDLELAEQRRIAQENQAKLDAIEAEKRAAEQAEAAKQAEIDRQTAEAKRIEDERLKREADTKHKAAINRQALTDLIEHADITEEQAKLVIKCIAKRLITGVTINY